MIDAFFPLFILCSPMEPTACETLKGPIFFDEAECTADLLTNGLFHVSQNYPSDIHIAYLGCVEGTIEGEPA